MSKYALYGIFLQTLLGSLLLAKDGKAQKVSIDEIYLSINLQDATLKEVFDSISKKTNFKFAYEKYYVDLQEKLNATTLSSPDQQASLGNLLRKISRNSNLKFKRVNNSIFVSSKGIFSKNVEEVMDTPMAQDVTISGKVTAQEDGTPLPGVSILVAGTAIGSTTNLDGEYKITAPEGSTLIFSYIGYKSQEITLGNQTVLNVSLSPDVSQLEEVVVVGYGSQKKSDMTGSVVAINTKELEDRPNTNVLQSLQSAIPGLNITNTNSEPGASPSVLLRGANSLTADNEPLMIVDGIPYSGNMNDFNPNDIESVSVLKDASAAAIYGSRGSNGVILITTKRGEKGKAKINYRGYYGVQMVENKLDLLDGPGYVKFIQDFKRYNGSSDLDPENILMNSELENYQNGHENDWQDLVFRAAPQQEHQISVSGGSDKTQYYTSFAYLDQKGVVENSSFKRYSIRTNLDQTITDWFKLGLSIQLSKKDYGGLRPSITNAIKISPYGKLKDENGKYTFYPQEPQQYYSNPFADDGAYQDRFSQEAFTNFFADIQLPFIPGLSYRINTGYNFNAYDMGNYYGKETLTGRQPSGLANVENTLTKEWTLENILKYQKTFGVHRLNVTALYSSQGWDKKVATMEGKGFVNDDNLYHDMEGAEQLKGNTILTEKGMISYMFRVNYSLLDKYFITVTGRKDGFSGFGENNKYGFFPSVALGWTLSEENFIKNISVIDYLKLRLSYGRNGNQAIDPYKTKDGFANRYYVYGDQGEMANGVVLNTVGNPNLRWEGTNSLNIGIDYELLDNRLSGTIDFYKSNTTDLLMSRQVPVMNGYRSMYYNVGETQNWGIEFNVKSVNIDNGNFQWTTNLNFSLNRDEIVALRGDGKDDLANKWFIGEPLRVYYDYRMIGVWQEGDDIANSAQPSAKPGDAKIKDVNEDGKITKEDREIIGSRLPKWIGGITNTFSYKNFSLSIFINTVQGITRQNNLLDPGEWLPEKNTNYLDIPYWTPERPSNEFVSPGYNENSLGHMYYQDASYVRIRDISLAYRFPAATLDRLGLSNLKLYLSGRNLHTFTDWIGYDPESSNSYGAYPNARTFILGVNLSL
ncbi:SusC/RagA family TonB-linked outer membrane protein [Rapidithrix thailandica]